MYLVIALIVYALIGIWYLAPLRPRRRSPAMVDAEALRSASARELRRSPAVRRAQPGRFDPLLVNRRRSGGGS